MDNKHKQQQRRKKEYCVRWCCVVLPVLRLALSFAPNRINAPESLFHVRFKRFAMVIFHFTLNVTIIILMLYIVYIRNERTRDRKSESKRVRKWVEICRTGKRSAMNIDKKHVRNINKCTTWNKRVKSHTRTQTHSLYANSVYSREFFWFSNFFPARILLK